MTAFGFATLKNPYVIFDWYERIILANNLWQNKSEIGRLTLEKHSKFNKMLTFLLKMPKAV